jgi:hypothetical protein
VAIELKSGATVDVATIDPGQKAVRVALYKPEGEFYMARATSGILAAALAVDAPVFAMRHGAAAVKAAYIHKIDIGFGATVAFTTGSQTGFYLQRFSVAALAAGTSYLASILRYDTADASEMGDLRASTTAALTSAGVTFAADSVPLISFPGPTLNQMIGPVTVFDSTESAPIKLAAGEGLCLRNLVVWPAAGTGVLTCRVVWAER